MPKPASEERSEEREPCEDIDEAEDEAAWNSVQGAQAFITSALVGAAVFLFMFFAMGIGILPAAIVALLCAIYSAGLLTTAARSLRADLSSDERLRDRVRVVQRLRPLGVLTCIIVALVVAGAVGMSRLSVHDLKALDAAINIEKLRDDYEKVHGTGAYQAAMKQLHMTEHELDEHLFGFRYHDAVTAVTNPIALGGIAFFGTLACTLLLVGALEIPAMGIGLAPVLAEIQGRLEAADHRDGQRDDADHRDEQRPPREKPIPADIQRVVDEDTDPSPLHIKPEKQLGLTGNARIDAIQTILQGTALWHVRAGFIVLVAFGVWLGAALAGIALGLVS